MATYAISDVQGCLEELEALIEKIRFDRRRDRLWFVGDLVNRGPDSVGVLRFVRDLGTSAVVVLGNHDLHLLAVAAGGGRDLKRKDTIRDVLDAPDRDELLDWLRSRPLVHRDGELGFAMVHAGLPPQWSIAQSAELAREVESALARRPAELFRDMYGDGPDSWHESLRGGERLRFIVNCCTRMRFVDGEGRVNFRLKVAPSEAPAPWMPWFKAPRRRSAGDRIVCGHWSALGYSSAANVWSIDTGCVWGDRLTALKLGPDPQTVSVRCRGNAKVGED
ncbi:MAG TPA: symmetrical bis(5'-nucleosyl)-tetraphosphatase [Steroidobacteraceae bacterium]|nr:symmetrical bis(5'-nucleosyl)-tetraphosphatase [Steroidobacteraceae bacterium]